MPYWFDQYKWLEYIIAEDATYCLDCYLFRHEIGKKSGGDSFIKGFTNWSKPHRFQKHVGEFDSLHNDCRRKSKTLMQQSQNESRDVSVKEQMGVLLRYVNGDGCVIERFFGISHVSDTKVVSLKTAIESMLTKHGLNISRVRGQGYDGASNMKGKINGLKTLILEKSLSAYYVHCFAHRLQLTLVVLLKTMMMSIFFFIVDTVTNLVGTSYKRQYIIREIQVAKVQEAIVI
ncbi:Zinc finger MYM-type protein 1 [Linum grandiflorum]